MHKKFLVKLWRLSSMNKNCDTSTLLLKGPYADHILIPQGSTGSSNFLISNENPYFSSCKSKISASNSL